MWSLLHLNFMAIVVFASELLYYVFRCVLVCLRKYMRTVLFWVKTMWLLTYFISPQTVPFYLCTLKQAIAQTLTSAHTSSSRLWFPVSTCLICFSDPLYKLDLLAKLELLLKSVDLAKVVLTNQFLSKSGKVR